MISSSLAPSVRPPAIPCRLFPAHNSSAIFSGLSCYLGAKLTSNERCLARWRSHAVSKPSTQGPCSIEILPPDPKYYDQYPYKGSFDYRLGLLQNGLPIRELSEKLKELTDDEPLHEFLGVKDKWEMINEVKSMLRSMGDGEISVSAYDTAWVALVPSLDGDGGPQFPSSLRWIIENQWTDGSWGDEGIFSAHDRIINTLACVIALKTWNICHERCEKGLLFLGENMWRLAEEEEVFMPIGFEVALPSLIDIARALDLEFPYDHQALQDIYSKRNLKLERIPKEVMYEVPTTLLHSLEGMRGLDWDRLLRLQSSDGSMLFSPASTACTLMHTNDEKCLKYLQRAIEKFHGGVPNVYPVDLFEHLWVVDRLQRLGVSRHFEAEIRESLEYVYRYWTEDGIGWNRDTKVHDVDDTAMGFRLLRLHGYDVSPDVFKYFEKDGEFFCFGGQSNQAVTGLYNLNRASQVVFPGEEILQRAKTFSYKFLREKQAANELLDKWIMTKDLEGEVEYALDFPLYASLPRIETRLYLEHYGGKDDVWIGKSLYRMPFVNNDLYLELAKADFNQCQAIHQLEWPGFQNWYEKCSLKGHGVSRRSVLKAYFLAAACIFEPERAIERLGWAQTAVLAEAVASYFSSNTCTEAARQQFINDFCDGHTRSRGKRTGEELLGTILDLIDQLALSIVRQRQLSSQHEIHQQLRCIWEDWMQSWRNNDAAANGHCGLGKAGIALLVVRTVELCGGQPDPIVHPEYSCLAQLTSSICARLQQRMQVSEANTNGNAIANDKAIDSEMQQLVQCVVRTSDGLSNQTKQTFLSVVKTFYYAAHCSSTALNSHITKVLFERVA